jgi:hypothetical protein
LGRGAAARREEAALSDAELIAALIAQPPGYEINLFGLLYVHRLEDGRYAVGIDKKLSGGGEELFADPAEAARLFLEKRREFMLGYEFEVV